MFMQGSGSPVHVNTGQGSLVTGPLTESRAQNGALSPFARDSGVGGAGMQLPITSWSPALKGFSPDEEEERDFLA